MSRGTHGVRMLVVACVTYAVVVIHALGAPRVQDVTPFPNARYRDMAFSPDGRSLAFHVPPAQSADAAASAPPPGIYVMGRNGGQPRLLTPHDGEERLAGPIFWSPDGQRIMLPGDLRRARAVLVIDVPDGAITRIPVTRHDSTRHMWVRRSDHVLRLIPAEAYRRFVFQRTDAGFMRRGSRFAVDEGWAVRGEQGTSAHHALWAIDPNGEVATLVMDKPEFAWIKLSPRQTRALIGDTQDGLYVVSGDGTGLRQVAEGALGVSLGLEVTYPQWAPDDSAVAYRTLVDPLGVYVGAHRLWVLDFAAAAEDD
jgi:hypothetical protein